MLYILYNKKTLLYFFSYDEQSNKTCYRK